MATTTQVLPTTDSGTATISEARRLFAGYLTPEALEVIARDPATRLTPVLVRCNCGRFTAPAQDVRHFMEIIARDAHEHPKTPGTDWVRDVSLVAR